MPSGSFGLEGLAIRREAPRQSVNDTPGLPIRRHGRSRAWVQGYITSYYQPHLGGEDLSGENPVIEIDRELLEAIDMLAEEQGVTRMEVISGLLILLGIDLT